MTSILKPALLSAALAMTAISAEAATTGLTTGTATVGAHNNGHFGAWLTAPQDMVYGFAISAGETAEITASGTLFIGEGTTVGPDGAFFSATTGGVYASEYTPLQEAEVDAIGGDGGPDMPHLGALIAAFVPQALFGSPSFAARDTDAGGSLASSSLFLVGSALSYTAAEDGVVFFGLNEAYTANNSGGFSVTFEVGAAPVPLPAGLPLLASAFAVAGFATRRRKAK
ncbi:MAG: hypothetical protein ACRBBT_00580 [Paracoccaceae bacterium]